MVALVLFLVFCMGKTTIAHLLPASPHTGVSSAFPPRTTELVCISALAQD